MKIQFCARSIEAVLIHPHLIFDQGPGGVSNGKTNQGGNLSVGNLRSNDQEFGADTHEEDALEWEDRLQSVIKQELHAPVTEVHHLLQHPCPYASIQITFSDVIEHISDHFRALEVLYSDYRSHFTLVCASFHLPTDYLQLVCSFLRS